MTWRNDAGGGVPWAVEGGAEISASILRLLSWAQMGGNEGVLSSTDLEVKALDVPGTQIRAMPGACSILNRALGASREAYVGKLFEQDVKDVSPTGSGAGRSDLVVARITNPYIDGEPWQIPEPENRALGPYIETWVEPNVPSTTTTVTQLGFGWSAIPLARIDIPASTGTILQSMIHDLRSVVNPFTGGVQGPAGGATEPPPVVIPGGGGILLSTDTDPIAWPFTSAWQVTIPAQATHADIKITIENAQINGGNLLGTLQMIFAGIGQTPQGYQLAWPGGTGPTRQGMSLIYPDFPIPPEVRGMTVPIGVRAVVTSGLGTALADPNTRAVCEAKFKQKATTTA